MNSKTEFGRNCVITQQTRNEGRSIPLEASKEKEETSPRRKRARRQQEVPDLRASSPLEDETGSNSRSTTGCPALRKNPVTKDVRNVHENLRIGLKEWLKCGKISKEMACEKGPERSNHGEEL